MENLDAVTGQQVITRAMVDCDRCGIVHVPLRELMLRVGMHDGQAEVRYRCDECGQIRLRAIDADQASALSRTDVAVEWWEPSRELDEPHAGSPFDEADVHHFIDLLDDEVALPHALVGLTESSERETGSA